MTDDEIGAEIDRRIQETLARLDGEPQGNGAATQTGGRKSADPDG